jgi:hypothetical protein
MIFDFLIPRSRASIAAEERPYVPRWRIYRITLVRRVKSMTNLDKEFSLRAHFEGLPDFMDSMLRHAGIAAADCPAFSPMRQWGRTEERDGKTKRITYWVKATEFAELGIWRFVNDGGDFVEAHVGG